LKEKTMKTKRSKYFLSPGVDVPTSEEIWEGHRPFTGFFVDDDAGEADFVPAAAFMKKHPLWRLDVLQDIALDIEVVFNHAMVEYFRHLSTKWTGKSFPDRVVSFKAVCSKLGLRMPEGFDAVLLADEEYVKTQSATRAAKKRGPRD
jgi:hypothetical protein